MHRTTHRLASDSCSMHQKGFLILGRSDSGFCRFHLPQGFTLNNCSILIQESRSDSGFCFFHLPQGLTPNKCSILIQERLMAQDSEVCNAGKGSNLTEDGTAEGDASLMTDDGAFGAVGALSGDSLAHYSLAHHSCPMTAWHIIVAT